MKKRSTLTLALVAGLGCTALAQSTPTTIDPAIKNKNKTSQPIQILHPSQVNSQPQNGAGTQHKDAQNSNDPWTLAVSPTREHVELATLFIGDWSATSTLWREPGATPVTSTAKARFFTSMGGRFVETDYDGRNNEHVFRGTGVYGYNTAEKRYESTWIDSENTAILFFTGTRQDNTFTWNTTYTDPVTGAKKTARGVNVFEGKDRMTYTMYAIGSDGQEFKMLEIAYTRTGPGGPVEVTPLDTKNFTPNTNTIPGNSNGAKPVNNNPGTQTPANRTPGHTTSEPKRD